MEIQDYSQKNDEELVALTLADQDVFYYLIKRYEKKLLNYILRISNTSRETAEDILQEVFIKIYKNLNGFDADLKFSSWAYRITHNETMSHFRKKQTKLKITSIDDDENNNLINLLKSSLDTQRDFSNKETSQKVRDVINLLSEKYSEILILRYLEEKDYQEISDILQIPMGTVATLINRAKTKLKTEAIRNHLDELM